MLFNKLFNRNADDKPGHRNDQKKRTRAPEKHSNRARKLHQQMDVNDLRIGMVVVELDIPWEESPFMFQDLKLKTAKDIQDVQKACSYVFVDYDEYTLLDAPPPRAKSSGFELQASNSPYEVEVEDEFDSAREVHTLATTTINTLFEEIRLGAEVDGDKVKQAVNGCVESIIRNPDASVWLTRIQAKSEATARHSMNVAALSIVIGKSMHMTARELEDIGVAGMLHDVGKTSVPIELIDKNGPLDADELIEMRKHTRYGRDILMSTKSVMSGAADVAAAHHERIDGKGYPRGLSSERIPPMAKIVAIAEAYDTMTTHQVYRDALSPSEALQELYAARGSQFDEEFVVRFIDAIGIFPPGSIVEMVNGEVGIVLANTLDKLRPRVILILDNTKEAAEQRIVDLSQMERDDKDATYEIKMTHSDGAFGIDISEFQRAGLRFG